MTKSELKALEKAFGIPEPEKKNEFIETYKYKEQASHKKQLFPLIMKCASTAVAAVLVIGAWINLKDKGDIRKKPDISVITETTSEHVTETDITTAFTGTTEYIAGQTEKITSYTSVSASTTSATTGRKNTKSKNTDSKDGNSSITVTDVNENPHENNKTTEHTSDNSTSKVTSSAKTTSKTTEPTTNKTTSLGSTSKATTSRNTTSKMTTKPTTSRATTSKTTTKATTSKSTTSRAATKTTTRRTTTSRTTTSKKTTETKMTTKSGGITQTYTKALGTTTATTTEMYYSYTTYSGGDSKNPTTATSRDLTVMPPGQIYYPDENTFYHSAIGGGWNDVEYGDNVIEATVIDMMYVMIDGLPYTQCDVEVNHIFCGNGSFNETDRISIYIPGGCLPVEYFKEYNPDYSDLPDGIMVHDLGLRKNETVIGEEYLFLLGDYNPIYPYGAFSLISTPAFSIFNITPDGYDSIDDPSTLHAYP